MSKKNRKTKISAESRTCFHFCAAFLVCGICLVLYGNFLYKNVIDLDDVQTGLKATVVSADRISRDLSPSDKEIEEKKGYEGNELRYEYRVTYSVLIDDKEYTYTDTERYHNNNARNPKVGDTDVINAAVIDGKLIVNPETRGANQFNVSGYFLLALGVIAGFLGVILRK